MKKLITLAVMAGVLWPVAAHAELCDPSTRICIVNPPSPASPWLAPQLVQLRLPAEASSTYSRANWTQPGVVDYPVYLQSGRYPIKGGLQLIEQGAPGGTSLYQGTLEPKFGEGGPAATPFDGAVTLSVIAAQSDPLCMCVKEAIATFAGLPVRAPVGRFNWRITKSGKWFRAIMSFETRVALRATQILYVSGFDGKRIDLFPLPLMKRVVTATGPIRIEQKLSVRYVQRACTEYRRCTLWADGQLGTAAESPLEDGSLDSRSRRMK